MIIEMEKNATREEIKDVINVVINDFKFEAQVNTGEERTVIAVLGSNTGDIDTQSFEVLSGVERVVRIQRPFKLASRDFKPENTIVKIDNIEIGGKELIIMAGPCSVESEEQIIGCAFAAKKSGAKVLRGGAFKPRTSPFAFQGLKEEGLKFLFKAGLEAELLIVTEVVSSQDVELVASYADILQIGARNMQNYQLLEAVGKSKKPVLLKRGLSATIEEWLMAADYILRGNGEPKVILCNRGIRTFDNFTRFTYDVGILPGVRHLTHLPIITDPSHAAGNYRYVPDFAKMAVVGGADGLIVEIHPNPKKAMSDGAQSLTFSDFSLLMEELKKIAEVVGRKI
ncbi:MAG: 3-deoxy-7-phosphoheptulonate synthase [Patescibacteria group bacterium]